MPETAYIINEGPQFGAEGDVFTPTKFSKKKHEEMLRVVFSAIKDWRYIHYSLKIKNVDKKKWIDYFLKKNKIKGKYEYFG